MKLSIIIPTYNEEQNIDSVLSYIKQHSSPSTEIIVVDGNSTDKTRDLVKKHGVLCYTAKQKGRSHQLIEGANRAKGDIYYFLHADSYPPTTFENDILRQIHTGYESGIFQLKLDNDSWLLKKCIQSITSFKWFFGDSSLFITKEAYKQIGGFKPLKIMEDYEIVERCKKGKFIHLKNKLIVSSARKWEQNGILRTHFSYLLIFIMFKLNFSEKRMLKVYKRFK